MYRDGVADGNLYLKEDLANFLLACQKGRYSVLLAVNNKDGNCAFPQAYRDALTGLGLDTRFCDGGNYIAVLECGTIPLQQWGGAALSQSLTLADGAYATLTSGTLSIGGEEVDANDPGLNIVVYNHETGQVVDAIACNMEEKVLDKKTGETGLMPVLRR